MLRITVLFNQTKVTADVPGKKLDRIYNTRNRMTRAATSSMQ